MTTREAILRAFEDAEAVGYAPTVRELCAITGLKSTASVMAHLEVMARVGLIESHGRMQSRQWRLSRTERVRVAGEQFNEWRGGNESTPPLGTVWLASRGLL